MRSFHTDASTHVQSLLWASAPCVAFSGTPGAWLSLCFVVKLTLPPSYPPFPRSGFTSRPSRGFHRSGTTGTLTPAPFTYRTGLPAFCATPSCRSVSNHVAAWSSLHPPRQRDQRVSDFAMNEQARRSSPPNRVRYPTDQQFASGCSPPCLGNSVTFDYGVVAYSDTDFHRANVAPSRRTHPRVSLAGVQSEHRLDSR